MGILEAAKDIVLLAAGIVTIGVQVRKELRESREERRKRDQPPE